MKLIILGATLLSFSFSAFGWGQTGHRIVGEIAMKQLNGKSLSKVKKILEGRDLAEASTYADFFKSDRAFDQYNTWHYVNMPKGQTYLESKKSAKGDVIQGIIHFEDMLRNKKTTPEEQKLALRYLTHLVGDAHQPMHAGYPSDRGGNDIELTWFGEDKNLHWLWDEGIIDMQQLSYTEYMKQIYFPTKQEISSWSKSVYSEWLAESREIMPAAYKAVSSGKYWEYGYNYKFRDVISDRLVRAGVRLGNLLNQIFANTPITKEMLADRKAIKESMK